MKVRLFKCILSVLLCLLFVNCNDKVADNKSYNISLFNTYKNLLDSSSLLPEFSNSMLSDSLSQAISLEHGRVILICGKVVVNPKDTSIDLVYFAIEDNIAQSYHLHSESKGCRSEKLNVDPRSIEVRNWLEFCNHSYFHVFDPQSDKPTERTVLTVLDGNPIFCGILSDTLDVESGNSDEYMLNLNIQYIDRMLEVSEVGK